MWASERAGPFNNVITRLSDPASRATCFASIIRKAAKSAGSTSRGRARDTRSSAAFVEAAAKEQRPADGYFVTFWRLLVEYPEILAWEKLWTDGKHCDLRRHSSRGEGCAAWCASRLPHLARKSFSPFVRAEQDYALFAKVADFL
jgi:hypothetical protein